MTDYTLPLVPNPNPLHVLNGYDSQDMEDYGHACAEHVRGPLLARIAELERSFDELAAAVGWTKERCDQDGDSPADVAARLRAEVEAKAGEVGALRGFCQRVMQSWPEGDIDGFDLEQAAQEFGLLQKVEVSAPCGPACKCDEYGAEFPTDCYHRTALLRGNEPWVNPLAAEVEKLRAALSQCATAVGASAAPDCSVEFLACVPREVELVVEKYRADAERLNWLAAEFACNPHTGLGDVWYLPPRNLVGRDVRAAIDAARKGEGSEP
jgi:hypothetical protein